MSRGQRREERGSGRVEESTNTDERSTGAMDGAACIAKRVRAAVGTASRRRARAPPRGRAQRRCRAPRRRWLEPRAAASRERVGLRRARTRTNAARAPWTAPRASRSECEPPPAWRAGGERERRRANERSEAALRRGGAGLSHGQRRAERGSGQGEHEHWRKQQHGRDRRRRVYCAASTSRRRHGEPAASESAAARTSAATQPSAEATLA